MILYGYTIFKILKLFTSDNHNVTECVIKWNLAIVVYEKKNLVSYGTQFFLCEIQMPLLVRKL